MLSSLSIAIVVSVCVGTALIVTMAVRAARGPRTVGIAQVLYDVEHPEKTR